MMVLCCNASYWPVITVAEYCFTFFSSTRQLRCPIKSIDGPPCEVAYATLAMAYALYTQRGICCSRIVETAIYLQWRCCSLLSNRELLQCSMTTWHLDNKVERIHWRKLLRARSIGTRRNTYQYQDIHEQSDQIRPVHLILDGNTWMHASPVIKFRRCLLSNVVKTKSLWGNCYNQKRLFSIPFHLTLFIMRAIAVNWRCPDTDMRWLLHRSTMTNNTHD